MVHIRECREVNHIFSCFLSVTNFNTIVIFLVEEVFNFNQTDLVPEDVMLLDVYTTIFLWIGKLSTAQERKLALEMALEYLRTGNS